MHDPTADERERDRRLRAEIDPLIGQLSFTGKWELVMRLALDSVRQGFISAPLPGRAHDELPVIAGSSQRRRDGGGEEAQRPENPPPSS